MSATTTKTPDPTSVKRKKVWDDNENQDGIRHSRVTVTCLANGKVATDTTPNTNSVSVARVTLADGLPNLPTYDAGTKIAYTVSEAAVTGYTTTYSD